MRNIEGVLLDLQGVLYLEGEPIPGAPDAVSALMAAGLSVRFLTNTTTRPRREVAKRMTAMGFDVDVEDIITPAMAAGHLLKRMNCKRLRLVANEDLAEDFAGFDLVFERPDAVVMGDLHTGFNWSCLNSSFEAVRGGAALVALHRNRYCRRDGKIGLDLGPFVAAVEYAANVEASVVGKPEYAFFEFALGALGCKAETALMVGDDPFSDIDGAAKAGLHTVQVRTGKYLPDVDGDIRPDFTIDSIADLPRMLEI